MSTEVWFRNPELFIREAAEINASLLTWDRGILVKRNVDPVAQASMYFPASTDFRLLAVGEQGAAELRRGHGLDDPVAVYPSWVYGEDSIELLEDLLANPVADDPAMTDSTTLPPDERPVAGQEHRVMVLRLPPASTVVGRRFLVTLAEIQADYPDAIMHIHGLYGFRAAFGNGFGAVDIEPRELARRGKVVLPNGKEVTYEKAALTPQWVTVLGYSPKDLVEPRNRCMFNMRAAQWAGENFEKDIKFRVTASPEPPDTTSTSVVPVETKSPFIRPTKAQLGDKFVCNECSLADTCKYFREGSVCSLPDAASKPLADHFKTRNSDTIIDGLAELMAQQAERLQMGRSNEALMGELDPEVTKIIDGLFAKGVQLAKLVNPTLVPKGPLVAIQNNNGVGPAALPQGATPQEIASVAVGALEAAGWQRSEITPEALEAAMQGAVPAPPPRAIEAVIADD